MQHRQKYSQKYLDYSSCSCAGGFTILNRTLDPLVTTLLLSRQKNDSNVCGTPSSSSLLPPLSSELLPSADCPPSDPAVIACCAAASDAAPPASPAVGSIAGLAVVSASCWLTSAAGVVVAAGWWGFAGTLGGIQPAEPATAQGCIDSVQEHPFAAGGRIRTTWPDSHYLARFHPMDRWAPV